MTASANRQEPLRFADGALVGLPGQLRDEAVEAFMVLREGFEPSEGLVCKPQDLVRGDCSAHAYPWRVHFVDALPKTPGGKVRRYVLCRSGQPV